MINTKTDKKIDKQRSLKSKYIKWQKFSVDIIFKWALRRTLEAFYDLKKFVCSVGSILRPGRFRRDPRQLDEEEEMWFNDDEYEDENGPNANAANSPSGPAATSPGAAMLSPSTSISPSGLSQLQQSPTASGNSASGMTNATSPASKQYLN